MRILVIQTAFIGDVILITPLIKQLKMVFPNSLIDVVVMATCAKLLENNPNINKIIVFNKKSGFLSFKKFIKEVKSNGYDVSISPHSSFRTGLLTFLARIKTRIGFKRNLQKYLLTESIPHPKYIHKKNKNLNLLSILKQSPQYSLNTELFPSNDDYQKAHNLMDSFLSPVILISPGSVWPTKRWPVENYLQLTNKLLDNDFCIVLSGSQAEREICDYIYQNTEKKNKIKNIAGEYNLLESAAVIDKVELVICNDSGALHIANAMNTPVFAFFGPTVKNIGYFPYRENDFIFQTNLPCRPCGSHGGRKCPQKHFGCMKKIEVDIVFNKIRDFFDVEKRLIESD